MFLAFKALLILFCFTPQSVFAKEANPLKGWSSVYNCSSTIVSTNNPQFDVREESIYLFTLMFHRDVPGRSLGILVEQGLKNAFPLNNVWQSTSCGQQIHEGYLNHDCAPRVTNYFLEIRSQEVDGQKFKRFIQEKACLSEHHCSAEEFYFDTPEFTSDGFTTDVYRSGRKLFNMHCTHFDIG